MSENVNFYQGSKENYNPSEMQGGLYFSKDSKEILLNGESYGNATPADEEDITAESGNLKLKDRAYDEENFSGKGYVILRKNIQEGKNILTQEMINQANTVYEIRYDFDLNGANITIPENCVIKFNGGSINNGNIKITKTSTIDVSNGTIQSCDFTSSRPRIIGNTNNFVDCTGAYLFLNTDDNEWVWDVTNLPSWLSQFNLSPGEGVEDNSDKLNALLSSRLYTTACVEHKVKLLFPSNWSLTDSPITYIFKKPIVFSGREVRFILTGCLKFDFSDYSYRSLKDIEDGIESPNLNCFDFTSCDVVEILGIKSKNSIDSSNKISAPYIDCGEDTINGDYFVRQEINGVRYYTTDDQYGIRIVNSNYVHINNIEIFNTQYAISSQAQFQLIENCYIHDVVNDNGITTLGAHSTYMDRHNMAIIRNCRVENILGVGINIQSFFGLVENCLAKNCGNNCINEPNYGTRGSGTAGGGFSVESLSDTQGLWYNNVNVTFNNCKAIDCYNYAFGSDSGGVCLTNCIAENISDTYKEISSSDFLYSSNSIRKGAFFHLGNTQYSQNPRKMYPCFAVNCRIDNVDKVYYNQNNAENSNVPYFFISNSYIKDVQYSKHISSLDFYGCIVSNSCLDNVQIEKLTPINCYNFLGEKVIPTSGPTSSRPLNPESGFEYYDTDINKPVYWNGTEWIDPTQSIEWAVIE